MVAHSSFICCVLCYVKEISNNVLMHFKGAASSLIEELGAERALCCTLACMTGHTEEMRTRSLLSNSDNFVTVMNSLQRK